MKIDIHMKDFDTRQEYNRARMKVYNRQKHMKQRLDRFYELLEIVRKYEKENDDNSFLASRLASECKYKLVIDKDLT